MRLKDRVVLVFGAGASGQGHTGTAVDRWGNGQAAAVLYGREGAQVVAIDQFTAAAEATASIIALEGNAGLALQADVTKPDDVNRVIDAALSRYGRIDVLHNNVGMADIGALEDITEVRWRRAIEVNLSGVYRTCRRVIPVMRRQRRGVIVNISSVAGALINRYPYFGYNAAKAGLNHFTRALAVNYARDGIRANVVMPGMMDTPMVRHQIIQQHGDAEAASQARAATVPMGRQGDAWDVARAALFLASDDAAYITGVCLPVDGGLSCLAE